MIGLALSLLSPVIGFFTSGWIGQLLAPIITFLTKLAEILAIVLGWLVRQVLDGLGWIFKRPSATIALCVLMYGSYAYASYVKPIITSKPKVERKYSRSKHKSHKPRVWRSERKPKYCYWYERCYLFGD